MSQSDALEQDGSTPEVARTKSRNAEAFFDLVQEMKRQDVQLDSPKLVRLAELIEELDTLDAEYEAVFAETEGDDSNEAVIRRVEAGMLRDYDQDAVLRSIREEFRPYLDGLASRYRWQRRLGRLVGGVLAALTCLPAIAGWWIEWWLFVHPGIRLVWRDIDSALGGLTGLVAFALMWIAFLLPLWPAIRFAEPAYRFGFSLVTGDDTSGDRPAQQA